MADRALMLSQSAARIEFLSLPTSFQAGALATIGLKVSNIGAGQKLPTTGFPEGHEVWIDIKVTKNSCE